MFWFLFVLILGKKVLLYSLLKLLKLDKVFKFEIWYYGFFLDFLKSLSKDLIFLKLLLILILKFVLFLILFYWELVIILIFDKLMV